MKNNNYLFAVASVRAKENSLLKQSDIEQLVNSDSYKRAVDLLSEKGYEISEQSDYSLVLDSELEKAWSFVSSSAPEAEALKAFIIKNDFQNLKAVLKAEVMNYNAENYFVKPCVIDPQKLYKAVSERKFEDLPDFIGECAKEAFDIIAKTENAQLCDALIDAATLKAIISFAQEGNDELLDEYANTFCLAADIKTAFRAIKTGKSKVFLNTAIAQNKFINKDDFINATIAGMEEFLEYLSSAGLNDYREELEKSASAFEKYCDDKMLSIIKKAKMTSFGVSPLAAYYLAKETEIKCLRIILCAKQSFVSSDIIRERLRELYV